MKNEQIFLRELNGSFNLRQTKVDKPTNLYFVVRIEGKQFKFATGVKVYPKHWNNEKQRAYVSYILSELDNKNNEVVNNRISEILFSFSEYKQYLCDNPNKMDEMLNILKSYIYKSNMNKKVESIELCAYLKQCVKKDNISKGSKDAYIRAIEWFDKYIRDEDIILQSYNEINTRIFRDFQDYLLNVTGQRTQDGKLSIRYINDTLKTVHQRINAYCVSNGLMDRNIFINIILPILNQKADNADIALRDDEILKLWDYKSESKIEDNIKDIFLLNCLTGQRISDTEKIADNVENISDITTIKLVQKKTGKYINCSIIFELAKEILNKYSTGLPNVSKTTINKYIKEIARKAGIEGKELISRQTKDGVNSESKHRYECITSHTGKRTFITLLKLREWDDSKIMMYSGHRDKRMVEHYSKIKNTLDYEIFNRNKKEHPELILKTVEEKERIELGKERISKKKILDYLFNRDKLLKLRDLYNEGIDIFNLNDTIQTINVIKNISTIEKAKEGLEKNNIDRSRYYEAVNDLDGFILELSKHYSDASIYQIFEKKVIELGLSDIIKKIDSIDEINGFWQQLEMVELHKQGII